MLFTKLYFDETEFFLAFGDVAALDSLGVRQHAAVKRANITADLEASVQLYAMEKVGLEDVFFPLSDRAAVRYFPGKVGVSSKGLGKSALEDKREAFKLALKDRDVSAAPLFHCELCMCA